VPDVGREPGRLEGVEVSAQGKAEASAGFWLDRPVLVTGGTGLLGSWLTEELVRRKAAAVGIVRDSVPRSNLVRSGSLDRINVVHGDIADPELVLRTVNEYEVDTVFHLAAQTIVSIANRSPISTFEANIKGTWNVLEACRLSSTVKRVVVASSDKAYGAADKLPYDEETPLRGKHPYDVSKSCADLLVGAYVTTYGLPATVTRCGNLFGGGDLNFNRIIPGTIRSVLRGEKPIIRSDGTYVRDYFYVKDAVAAYLMLAERLEEEGVRGEAFNFSTEQRFTVLEITRAVIDAMKSDLEPVVKNEVKGEILEQSLSAAKARKVLGWKPLFSIEKGLEETIAWYREYFG